MRGLQRFARASVKVLGLATGPLLLSRSPVTVFTLHRVSESQTGEMMLSPAFLQRFLKAMMARYQVVAWADYAEGRAVLGKAAKPVAVLTVDDAFSDAYTHLFPILQQLGLPILLFVPTQFIQPPHCAPVSYAHNAADYRPCTWAQLRAMQASGLVTLGAHSHAHLTVNTQSSAQLIEDLEQCHALFAANGLPRPRWYAYPRGIFTPAVAKVLARYYEGAFAGAPHHALPAPLAHMAIARVPVRGSDQGLFWRFKLAGWRSAEEGIVERGKGLLALGRHQK